MIMVDADMGIDLNEVRGHIERLRAAGGGLNGYERRCLRKDLAFIAEQGIEVVVRGDGRYPGALSRTFPRKAPRMIFMKGNLSLLSRPGIMVCGSRGASGLGLDFAYKCGRLVAEAGYVLISGYARGADMAAHLGALEAGGESMALVPYGLTRFSVRSVLADVLDEGNFLVGSELPPVSGFTVKAALRRNRFLAAMAGAVIVVEPGDTGGTWYTAERAAGMGRPLFHFTGERGEAGERLASLGSRGIVMRRNAPVLDEVYACRGGGM